MLALVLAAASAIVAVLLTRTNNAHRVPSDVYLPKITPRFFLARLQ